MKKIKYLISILMATASVANASIGDWWRGFCARFLVADDPEQFTDVDPETLVYLMDQFHSPGAYRQALALILHGRISDYVDNETLLKAVRRYEAIEEASKNRRGYE